MRRGIASLIGCGLVVIASSPVSAQGYAAPKTPWGDPDLQAIWSGDSAFGIPLQRPQPLGHGWPADSGKRPPASQP